MHVFWRVEMWCRRQAAAAILPLLLAGWLTGESSEALTTFGKSNTDAPKNIQPTAPPARACNRQAECLGVNSASCVRTHYDPVTRCLCGDNSPPLNGRCEPVTKSLYHACANSDECNDGLVCLTPNITGTAPAHLRVHAPTDKICLCDTENGYREKEHACNDIFAIVKLKTGMEAKDDIVLYGFGARSDFVCLTPNITGTAPAHLRVHAPTDKICLCDTENGYREKEHACNDADIIKISLLAVAFVTCLRKILDH